MTDEELNQKMDRVTSKKVTRQPKRRKKGHKTNAYQLWAQLNEEQLRKLGYIK